MISYRTATAKDAVQVAQLHALSWQQNYRGSFNDQYLNHEVGAERLKFWTKRLKEQDKNECVLLAEAEKQVVGFSCVCTNEDPHWGALLDNLHVARTHSGKGIGKVLMQQSAQWVHDQTPESMLYLWVLATNTRGIKFYERLGGVQQETILDKMYGGGEALVHRIVWEDLSCLINGGAIEASR